MQNPHLRGSTLPSIVLPLAILICTPMVPSATTGGGLVTAYRDRNSAARFKSEASYSHWTWRLKMPFYQNICHPSWMLIVRYSNPVLPSVRATSFTATYRGCIKPHLNGEFLVILSVFSSSTSTS